MVSPLGADTILSGCADIQKSGAYTLDRDITGTLGSACLRIHDVTDVQLDCHGHSITTDASALAALVVETVKNFTIKACSLPQLSGYSLFVGNSANGTIAKNLIKDMVVNETLAEDASSVRITDNKFSVLNNADSTTDPFSEGDTGVIPLEPGINWIQAAALAVPKVASETTPPNGTIVSAASPRVFPNPWRVDRDKNQEVTFDQLPANSTIKIFTVSAHWVKSLSVTGTSAQWDLRNSAGEDVASGFYLYLITNDQGQKIVGKLAVIR